MKSFPRQPIKRVLLERNGYRHSVVAHPIVPNVDVVQVECLKCNWWITVDGYILDYLVPQIEEEHPFICGMAAPLPPCDLSVIA